MGRSDWLLNIKIYSFVSAFYVGGWHLQRGPQLRPQVTHLRSSLIISGDSFHGEENNELQVTSYLLSSVKTFPLAVCHLSALNHNNCNLQSALSGKCHVISKYLDSLL